MIVREKVDIVRQEIFNAQEGGYDHRELPLDKIAEQLHAYSFECEKWTEREVREAVDLWRITPYTREHFEHSSWRTTVFADGANGYARQEHQNTYDDRLEMVSVRVRTGAIWTHQYRFAPSGVLWLTFEEALAELNKADGRDL